MNTKSTSISETSGQGATSLSRIEHLPGRDCFADISITLNSLQHENKTISLRKVNSIFDYRPHHNTAYDSLTSEQYTDLNYLSEGRVKRKNIHYD